MSHLKNNAYSFGRTTIANLDANNTLLWLHTTFAFLYLLSEHFSTVRSGVTAGTSMFTFIVLIITIIICLSHVCFGHFKYLSAHNYKIDTQDVDGVENGQVVCAPASNKSAMYIALVLQDPNSEEAGSSVSGEEDGQGSSQDEEIINVGNGLNKDFQSGEDSLIDNEMRH
ncbi:mechanosensitive cation channel TMEM63B-like [Genypterus blacodes]|uniref:mechanosensitive cation channel TMEM63B-like n=1 Tax=Genypterus blacodes TaxID=154954 RepID=UPI003F77258F